MECSAYDRLSDAFAAHDGRLHGADDTSTLEPLVEAARGFLMAQAGARPLWIVGRIQRTHGGLRLPVVWEFQGLFDTLEAAVAICDDDCFVGPARLNHALPPASADWAGVFYPTLEPDKLLLARAARSTWRAGDDGFLQNGELT